MKDDPQKKQGNARTKKSFRSRLKLFSANFWIMIFFMNDSDLIYPFIPQIKIINNSNLNLPMIFLTLSIFLKIFDQDFQKKGIKNWILLFVIREF